MLGRKMIKRNLSTETVNILRVVMIAAVSAVLVMGFAFPALAFNASSTPFSYSGKIVAIDDFAKTITVQAGIDDQLTFRVNDIASVTRCNSPESFSNLRVGDEVTIAYYETGVGNLITNDVALLPSADMMNQCS